MKLLLLALLGLVSTMATDEKEIDPSEFEILEDPGDTLDADELLALEKDDVPRKELEGLLKQMRNSYEGQKMPFEPPPGYINMTKRSKPMFDEKSVTNVISNTDTDDSTSSETTTATDNSTSSETTTATDNSTSSETTTATALIRKGRQAVNWYYCPHKNYMLRWFPIFSGSFRTDVCYVPWYSWQRIIYARCTRPRCRLAQDDLSPTTKWRGRCRPSCYTKRRILALCFNYCRQQWYWRWVVKNLPQACRCSTC